MSLDTAPNFPPNQLNTDNPPAIGDPRKVCPAVAAYWERRLVTEQLKAQMESRIRDEIEECYFCYEPRVDQELVVRGAEVVLEIEECWQQHTTASTASVMVTETTVQSSPTVLRPSIATRLRSVRQTRRQKSINPQAKRFLTDEESRLLSRGVLPGTVLNWNLVQLRGRQRYCYRQIVARQRRGRQKRASFVLA